MADFQLHPDFPVTFNADGMATVHNADFRNDPRFSEAYRLGEATLPGLAESGGVAWRAYVCCWAAAHATHLQGDFVECGVNTGIYSRAIVQYVNFKAMPERRFFLLDTFQGIPLEQLTPEEAAAGEIARYNQNQNYADCYDDVRRIFADFPNVVIVRGRVPDTLPAITSDRIAYASIDMNSTAPEIAAGNFLWPRLVSGAVTVLDDYGWRPHIRQKEAWDKFAGERGLSVLSLPTGQGLLIKP